MEQEAKLLRQIEKKYSDQIKKLFEKNKIEYVSVDGDYLDRFTKVKDIIKEKFGVVTEW